MRLKTLLGAVGLAAGLLTFAAPAQAASLPCNLGGSGSSASATCYSGSSITWRLAVDCLDTTNIKWPKLVTTLYGQYIKGDGTESMSCNPSLRAIGRIEVK